jgi:hypothetical protein
LRGIPMFLGGKALLKTYISQLEIYRCPLVRRGVASRPAVEGVSESPRTSGGVASPHPHRQRVPWGPHVDPWGSIRGGGGEDPHGAVALRTLPLRVPCGPRGDPMGNIVPCDLLYSLEFYRNGKCALRGKSTWRANHQRKYRRIQLGVMRLKGERATNRFLQVHGPNQHHD